MFWKTIQIFFERTNCKFKPLNKNLVDEIWKRKIQKNKKKFYILPGSSVSKSYKSKINKVASYLKNNGADFHFITASENNAWLLNIRGKDLPNSPVANFQAIFSIKNEIFLFGNIRIVI